ncbi:MAG: glycosyl hydrolase family 18 protein [bacterium]|nr:glycosyl hydrolase family 18 protein [bacterium]
MANLKSKGIFPVILMIILLPLSIFADILGLQMSGWMTSLNDLKKEEDYLSEFYCIRLFSVWEIRNERFVKSWGLIPNEVNESRVLTIPCVRISSDSINLIPDLNLHDIIQDLIKQLELQKGSIIELNIERNQKSINGLAYSKFKKILSEFYKNGIKVNMVVEPQLMSEWNKNEWNAVDYMINEYVLMLYDYDKNSSKPHNPAPINNVENDIKRFLKINGNPRKIILGIPAYAYIWDIEKKDRQYLGSFWLEDEFPEYFFTSISVKSYILSWNEEGNVLLPKYLICNKEKEILNWDEEYDAFYFNIKRENKYYIVYFEDILSYCSKFELAEKYDLKGVSFWMLGREDRLLFDLINQVKKLNISSTKAKEYKIIKEQMKYKSRILFNQNEINDCRIEKQSKNSILSWKNYFFQF